MIVLCVEQHTPKWGEARHGKITASAAKYALAARGTKGRTDYVDDLVAGLRGIPDFKDEEVPPWFTDGRYYESWSRGWYSWTYDVDVVQIGFAVHEEYSFIGASHDGLIEPDGKIEVGARVQCPTVFETKYRKSLKTFDEHKSIGVNASVMAQLQTQMLVVGPKCRRAVYCNYWRADKQDLEKGHVKIVERDDAYIQNTLLPAFVGLWAEVQERLAA